MNVLNTVDGVDTVGMINIVNNNVKSLINELILDFEPEPTPSKLLIGNVSFNVTPVDNCTPLFDVIKRSFEKQYREQVNEKIADIEKLKVSFESLVASSTKEINNKIKFLDNQIKETFVIPRISYEQSIQGISLIPTEKTGQLQWLVRRIYSPKYVDRRPIEPAYIKKMASNIYIMVQTDGYTVTNVSTRYIKTLGYFQHYHQIRPDCWGNWVPPKTWSNVNDIIAIADAAESVLENINTMSMASRAPALLPRLQTLLQHTSRTEMRETPTQQAPINSNAASRREGLNNLNNTNDVWAN